MAKKKATKKKGAKKTTKKKGAKKTAKKGEGKAKRILATKKEAMAKHKEFKKEVGSKLIPKSKVRAYFKHLGIRASNDLSDSLAEEVYAIMKKGALRAIKNGRKTVRSWDF
jgi:thiamine monophosphate kinase